MKRQSASFGLDIRRACEAVKRAGSQPPLTLHRPGFVYLVGAGPGDPELLTVAAIKRIRAADVIVYDHLVNAEILHLKRQRARLVYAGKQSGRHALPQAEINAMLVTLARAGECVVRLKGGDPFVFGRGGEEMEFLARHGVGCEVIPGVTSAQGAACYAGIPLTHREHAQACVFVTGHLKDGTCSLDWRSLAQPGQTVVIYMGLAALGEIALNLVRYGRADGTPVAAIERATCADQRVVIATLATIVHAAADAQLRSPTVLVVGEVVRLHGLLAAPADRLHVRASALQRSAGAVAKSAR